MYTVAAVNKFIHKMYILFLRQYFVYIILYFNTWFYQILAISSKFRLDQYEITASSQGP